MVERQTIVVAWTESVQIWDQEPFAVDLGRPPRMVEQIQVRACVWLLRGTEEDVARAEEYIRREYPDRGRVFSYPMNEPDPLARAKADMADPVYPTTEPDPLTRAKSGTWRTALDTGDSRR